MKINVNEKSYVLGNILFNKVRNNMISYTQLPKGLTVRVHVCEGIMLEHTHGTPRVIKTWGDTAIYDRSKQYYALAERNSQQCMGIFSQWIDLYLYTDSNVLYGYKQEDNEYTSSDLREYQGYEIDPEFSNMAWSHGLMAYHSQEANYKFSPEWEICCSDSSQMIGALGLIVTGDVTFASNIDVYSRLTMNGRAFSEDSFRSEGVIENVEDYSLEEWDHTEVWLKNPYPMRVWIKEWAINKPHIMEKAEEIASFYNIKIEIIK